MSMTGKSQNLHLLRAMMLLIVVTLIYYRMRRREKEGIKILKHSRHPGLREEQESSGAL